MNLVLPSSGSKPLEGLSFLLAEDNVTNQLVASQMLKTLGGEVEIAADGAIALDLLKSRDYDVLLIDIEMPRVSGLDVIRSVRSSGGALAQKPVIALTAYAMAEHREKIIGAGADGLIAKPISSIAALGNEIRAIVSERIGGAGAATAPEPEERADEAIARESRSETNTASVDETIFDALVATMGERTIGPVLKKAEDDLATARDQIEMAAESDDAVLLRGASHVVISVAGSVGAIRLQRQAEALNRLAHIEELGAALVLARELSKELNGVLKIIRVRREGIGS